MKKKMAIVSSFVLALALAGCASVHVEADSSAAASNPAASSEEPVTSIIEESSEPMPAERAAFIDLLNSFDRKVKESTFSFPKTFRQVQNLTSTSGAAQVSTKILDISANDYYAYTSFSSAGALTDESYSYIKEESGKFTIINATVLASGTKSADSGTYTSTDYTTLAAAQEAMLEKQTDNETAASNAYYWYSKVTTNSLFKSVANFFTRMSGVTAENYSGTLASGELSGEATYANLIGSAKLKVTAKDYLPILFENRDSGVDNPMDYNYTWTALTKTYPDLTQLTKK